MINKTLLESAVAPVAVTRTSGEFRLLATERIAAGEVIFQIEGEETHRSSRYSIQIGEHLHIDAGEQQDLEEMLDRYHWRFLNHSCDPNTLVRGLDVVALRAIDPWEELTFNYNTTEYEMAEPFECRCGASGCGRRIRGFKYLSAGERERLRGQLSEHLLRRLEAP